MGSICSKAKPKYREPLESKEKDKPSPPSQGTEKHESGEQEGRESKPVVTLLREKEEDITYGENQSPVLLPSPSKPAGLEESRPSDTTDNQSKLEVPEERKKGKRTILVSDEQLESNR